VTAEDKEATKLYQNYIKIISRLYNRNII